MPERDPRPAGARRERSDAGNPDGRTTSSPRIAPDFAWLESGLAIGSRPFADQRARIRELGITAVVALHEPGEGEEDAWRAVGVDYLALPTRDWVGIPTQRFTEVVDSVLARLDQGETVLLHCLAGLNRAPTAAAAILCKRDGLSPEEAVAQVRAARPSAAPTPEQMASLRAWARLHARTHQD